MSIRVNPAAPANNNTQIKFTLHSLSFTPYKEDGNVKNSVVIKSALTYLNQEIMGGRGFLLDKHRNRKGENERVLFMPPVRVVPHKHRYIGTIALLRSGREPLVKPDDQFTLIPLKIANGKPCERTHFVIDYSTDNVIICLEFNNEGPRLSDLEHYLRHLIVDRLRHAKSMSIVTHMETTLDDTLNNLYNVLNIEIKAEPQKLDSLGENFRPYFRGMSGFSDLVKPKFLKLEALFPGKEKGVRALNNGANLLIRGLLKKFKESPDTMNVFDNFVVKYEDKDGNEPFFNLLSGKKEIIIDVDLSTIKGRLGMYDLVESEFDNFIAARGAS